MTFNTTGLMSSIRQDWRTPSKLYEELNKEFNFDFDPCPVNPTFDGLNVEWGKVNFINPPYRDSASWIKKAHDEWKRGKTCVMLIPARTDTRAFHQYIYNQAELRLSKAD